MKVNVRVWVGNTLYGEGDGHCNNVAAIAGVAIDVMEAMPAEKTINGKSVQQTDWTDIKIIVSRYG